MSLVLKPLPGDSPRLHSQSCLRAEVRNTEVSSCPFVRCRGHIDLRMQIDVERARRTAEIYVPQPIDHQIVSRLCHRRSATALTCWCRPRETASSGRTAG